MAITWNTLEVTDLKNGEYYVQAQQVDDGVPGKVFSDKFTGKPTNENVEDALAPIVKAYREKLATSATEAGKIGLAGLETKIGGL